MEMVLASKIDSDFTIPSFHIYVYTNSNICRSWRFNFVTHFAHLFLCQDLSVKEAAVIREGAKRNFRNCSSLH
jgi:hypothetical protein